MIKGLFYNFIKDNHIFYLYLIICSISYILQVFGSSYVYKKFFSKDISKNFDNVFKQICILWISIFILYIIKSKSESIIIPDILVYIRKEIILNYMNTNGKFFSEKDIEKDSLKMIDFGFYFERVVLWLIESVIPTIILIVFMNIYFLIKRPIVGFMLLISNIISITVIKHFFNKMLNVITERQEHQDQVLVSISEKLNNMMDIHLNNKINDTVEETQVMMKKYKEKVHNQFNLIMNFINSLKTINYSFNLLNIFILYKTTPNIEEFFGLFSIFILFIPIFENMTQQIPMKLANINDLLIISNYLIDNKKILLDEKGNMYNENKEQLNKSNINSINSITFDNITFKYNSNNSSNNNNNENKNILENFSLIIKNKDKIAILAESGSGKTTLIKLLLGFYKPKSGKILINNIDINNLNINDIRRKINYINQRTLILNDTIINNMKFGNNKTDNEIINLLKKYNLLTIFKNSIYQEVEIGGRNISLGMQKIIFLIRGVLKDSEVYIFDEPLTSLDKETRKKVINMIRDYTNNKTLIIITHDNEILELVNKKIKL
jgi:ABC-type multidrug transport system fused ATPase/permease subunit